MRPKLLLLLCCALQQQTRVAMQAPHTPTTATQAHREAKGRLA